MENKINYDFIKEYIEDLTPPSTPFLEELLMDARKRYIPVITKDTRRFLEVLLPLFAPEKILEVGTAIGYSAMTFASILPKAIITTIEIDEALYEEAYSNIKKAELSQRIQLICDDARNVLPYLPLSFDLIFLDAAKGQYTEYFPFIKKLLRPGGLLISDNILFKGLVAEESLVPKSKRAIVHDLADYNRCLAEDQELVTSFLPVGDGVALSYKKPEETP